MSTIIPPSSDPERLADFIEQHAPGVIQTVVAALRGSAGSGPATIEHPIGRTTMQWRKVGTIDNFDHPWPEVHEHYPPMVVYEAADNVGLVRFCIGVPRERMPVYGRERGWASVWEVVNGQPREQRAVFVDTDDFAATGERIALISGKDGQPKKLFEPNDAPLLPPVYSGMRTAVHRTVCSGPYAKNRLGVLATDDEPEVMLNHALAHLRLRT
jgi:hypothetical protein